MIVNRVVYRDVRYEGRRISGTGRVWYYQNEQGNWNVLLNPRVMAVLDRLLEQEDNGVYIRIES